MVQPNYDYEKYSDVFKKFQQPMQELIELNMQTVQNVQHLKPEDFTKLNKPEEFLQKQVEVALANGHKALDYMQKSFHIMERAMLSCVKEAKEEIRK
ncbi:MAG: hypothetical protein CK424_03415 [Legionella sp.]|nr:MAG: hypothetical protein CK424_03415 [Legionella sp.]